MQFDTNLQAKDEGIYIWSVPVYNDYKSTNIFFMNIMNSNKTSARHAIYTTILLHLSSTILVNVTNYRSYKDTISNLRTLYAPSSNISSDAQ